MCMNLYQEPLLEKNNTMRIPEVPNKTITDANRNRMRETTKIKQNWSIKPTNLPNVK